MREWNKRIALLALAVFLVELLGGFWAGSVAVLAYCIMWTQGIVQVGVSELVLYLAKKDDKS